jgi:hypothetical protein
MRNGRLRRAPVAIAAALAMVVLFAVQRAVLEAAARLESPVDLFFDPQRPVTAALARSLPYHVVDPVFGPPASLHVAMIAIAVLQTLLLIVLYRALRDREVGAGERAMLGVVSVAMAIVALGTRAIEGFDAYAMAGYAKLGPAHAYAPPAAPFAHAFAAVSAIWGVPMRPAADGPGAIGLLALLLGHAPTLGGAILALRWLSVVALAAIVAILALRGAAPAVLALVALNPALAFVYVVDAHDAVGPALALGALATVPAWPLAAALLVACAAVVHPPLAATALAVFAGGNARRSIAYLALVVVLAFAGVALLGGTVYLAELGAQLRDALFVAPLALGSLLRHALLVVAAIALIVVFVRRVVWPGASWSLLALDGMVAPSSLLWPLPYAALARTASVELLVLLPLASALLDPAFTHFGLGQLAMAAMLVAALIDVARRRFIALEVAGRRP